VIVVSRAANAIRARRAAVALWILLSGRVPGRASYAVSRLAAGSDAASERGLGGLSAERLLRVATDSAERSAVTGNTSSAHALLDLGEAAPELGPVIVRQLRRAPDDLSAALYEAVVLDRAGGAARLSIALLACTQLERELEPDLERSVLARCIELLRRAPDPYDANAARVVGAARQAAAAIVARNPDLDEVLIATLTDSDARASLIAVAAAAFQERPAEAARRFVNYAKALRLSREQLTRFAEDCDSNRQPRVTLPTSKRRPWPATLRRVTHDWSGAYGGFVVVSIVPPIAAIAAAWFAAREVHGSLSTVGIDPTVAIGALALLAAVHVLSVQLAAQRLPGAIAAATAIPPLTLGGYLTGLAMLVCALLGHEQHPASWNPGFMATVLLIVFVFVIIFAVSTSLRATGLAPASAAAGWRYIGRARRTGRKAGRLHRNARDLQELIDNHGSLRRFTSPQETGERYPVLTSSSGFLWCDIPRLRKLVSRPALLNGENRLDITASPGVPLSTGEEVAALIPLGSAALDRHALRDADQAFEVRTERSLERFAELCAALAAQLPPLMRSGDPGAARRVLHALLRLLAEHIAADEKEWSGHARPLPLSPAITQVIDQAAASLAESQSDREGEMIARLLEGVIKLARPDDGVITLVTTRVSKNATNLTDFGVLYDAGCHAATTGARVGLQQAQEALHKHSRGTSDEARYANEVAGRLVTYCAAAAPNLSRAAWTRWWSAATDTPAADRVRIALRIGAAALPVGNLSLATEISTSLAGQDFGGIRQAIHDRETSAFENLLSELYGRLLGADAETRISDFISFAEDINASIPTAASAA
jgi:hypothetical protein